MTRKNAITAAAVGRALGIASFLLDLSRQARVAKNAIAEIGVAATSVMAQTPRKNSQTMGLRIGMASSLLAD
jgi:hypothetical protein